MDCAVLDSATSRSSCRQHLGAPVTRVSEPVPRRRSAQAGKVLALRFAAFGLTPSLTGSAAAYAYLFFGTADAVGVRLARFSALLQVDGSSPIRRSVACDQRGWSRFGFTKRTPTSRKRVCPTTRARRPGGLEHLSRG